jgi:hypothetical protein
MKFKTLTYLNNFVDANLLENGIYNSNKPYIYSNDTTIDSLIEQAYQLMDLVGNKMISESYINNLKACKLSYIEVKLLEE